MLKFKLLLLFLLTCLISHSQITKEELEDLIKSSKINRVYIFNSNLISKYEISPKSITNKETRKTSSYLEVTKVEGGDTTYMENGFKVKSKFTTFYIPYHKIKLIAIENYSDFQYLNIELQQ